MADNATLPLTGSGDSTVVVATDDVGSAHYQRIKVDAGGDGLGVPIVAGQQVAAASLPIVWASDKALPAGTNAIGKLAANSGVDIGDVDVTSISAGDNTIGRIKITDGTDVADVLDLTNSNPVAVAIVDGSGDQITSFGGGVQYTEGDTDATITGTALVFEGAGDALVAATGDATNGLDVDVTRVSGNVAVTIAQDVMLGTDFSDVFGTASLVTATQADDIANTVDGINATALAYVFDGTTWDRLRGDSTNGALVNLGANNDVTVTGTVTANLAAGTNNIGDVDVLSIAAGDNNIGNVDIVTVPADPFGANADAASATGSISAKLRFIASTGIPVTNTVTVSATNLDIRDLTSASDTVGVLQATASNLNAEVQGDGAHGASISGNPVRVGVQGRTTDPTAVTDAQTVNLIADTLGKQICLIGAAHDLRVSGRANLTTTTSTQIIAAAASKKTVITGIVVTNAHVQNSTKVQILDGSTVKAVLFAAAGGGGAAMGDGNGVLFVGTSNTAINAKATATLVAGDVHDVEVFLTGYQIGN